MANPFSSPTAGDVVTANKPWPIQWDNTTAGPVFIQLSYGDNLIAGNVTSSTSNNGSYTWYPNGDLAGQTFSNNYFLVICDINLGACSYTPDGRFSISASSSSSFSSSSSSSSLSSSLSVNIDPTSSSVSSSTFTTGSSTTTSHIISSSATILSTTSTSTATSSTSTSLPPTDTSIPTPSPESSSGLSTGAKVAIGVVIPVVVIFAFAIAFFWMRRRQKAQQISKHPSSASGEAYHKPELSGEGARVELPGGENERTGPFEKDGQARSELPGGDDHQSYALGTGIGSRRPIS